MASPPLTAAALTTRTTPTDALLPENSFTDLLKAQLDHPEHLHHQPTTFWTAMVKGEFAPSFGIPDKRAAALRHVLDALTDIGMARRGAAAAGRALRGMT